MAGNKNIFEILLKIKTDKESAGASGVSSATSQALDGVLSSIVKSLKEFQSSIDSAAAKIKSGGPTSGPVSGHTNAPIHEAGNVAKEAADAAVNASVDAIKDFSNNAINEAHKASQKASKEAVEPLTAISDVGVSILRQVGSLLKKDEASIVSSAMSQYRQAAKSMVEHPSDFDRPGSKKAGSADLDNLMKRVNFSLEDVSLGVNRSLLNLVNVVERGRKDLFSTDLSTIVESSVLNINKSLSKDIRRGSGAEGKSTIRVVETFTRDILKQVQKRIVDELEGLAGEFAFAELEGDKARMGALASKILAGSKTLVNLMEGVASAAGKGVMNPAVLKSAGAGAGPAINPNARFMYEKPARAEDSLSGAQKQALALLRDMENIPDVTERVRNAFKLLFTDASGDIIKLRQNFGVVVEAMKSAPQFGLLDRREAAAATKTLDQYAGAIEKIALSGGDKIRVPRFITELSGGVGKAAISAIDALRSKMASTGALPQGARQEKVLEVEDTAGGIQKYMIILNKAGDTADKVRVQVKSLNKELTAKEGMALAFRRVALWGTAAGVTYGAVAALRTGVKTMREVEFGVASLGKVMREADLDFAKFSDTAVKFAATMARSYGAGIQQVVEAMQIFAQQGFEMVDIQKLTEAAVLAANVTVLSQKEAAEGLTSAIHQFGIEAGNAIKIVDAWNEVANRNAVTEGTLTEALKKAGSAAGAVGINFDELNGMITAIGTATRQPGKEIGTSLRFIFQRTLRPETIGELSKLGVATKDLQGNFRGFMPILTELADKWEGFTRQQQLAVAQALGGARQYNSVLALLNNYHLALKATEESANSQGSAMRENARIMETAEKVFARFRASVDSLAISFGKSLLPAMKTVATGLETSINVFNMVPDSIKGIIAVLGVAAIGFTRFASSIDMAMNATLMSGGANIKQAFAAMGSGLIGAGKGDKFFDNAKVGKFTALERSMKALPDYSAAAGQELAKMGGTVVDVNGKIIQNVSSMSKLQLVTKGATLQTMELGAGGAIALGALNSPINKALVGLGKFGKVITSTVLQGLASVVGLLPVLGAGMKSFISSVAMGVGALQGLGVSLLVFGGVAAAIGAITYTIYKLASAEESYGKVAEAAVSSELAKREDVLITLNRQLSLYKQLERQGMKVGAGEGKTEQERKREANETGVYRSSFLERLDFEKTKQKSVLPIASISPGIIEGFDAFGNVVAKSSFAVSELAESAVKAQAHLVALSRLKIAEGFSRDALKAQKAFRGSVDELEKSKEAFQPQVNVFGTIVEGMDLWSEGVGKVISKNQALSAVLSQLEDQIGRIPKQADVETFSAFGANETVNRALELAAARKSRAYAGKYAKTLGGGDILNQYFLKAKGVVGAGLVGEETAEHLRQKNVLERSIEDVLKDIKEGRKKFTGKEVLIFEKGTTFGFDQAVITIDAGGRAMVSALDRNTHYFKRSLQEALAGAQGTVAVFDLSSLRKQIDESILKVKKQVAGAGTGLLSIPGKIDLGVKFNFELGDMDRLQKAGKETTQLLLDVFRAQQGYNRALEEFRKDAKSSAGESKVSAATSQALTERAANTAFLTNTLRFVSELEKLGNAMDKAVFKLEEANLADKIEAQFSNLYGSTKGFSEKLAITLPKTAEQLSPAEQVVQLSPDFAVGLRSLQRLSDTLKAQVVSSKLFSGRDLPRMFKDFTEKDKEVFSSIYQKTGGDEKTSLMGTTLLSIRDINKEGFNKLIELLGGKAAEGEVGTSGSVPKLDEVVSSFSVGLARVLQTGSVGPNTKSGTDWYLESFRKMRGGAGEYGGPKEMLGLGKFIKEEFIKGDVAGAYAKSIEFVLGEKERLSAKQRELLSKSGARTGGNVPESTEFDRNLKETVASIEAMNRAFDTLTGVGLEGFTQVFKEFKSRIPEIVGKRVGASGAVGGQLRKLGFEAEAEQAKRGAEAISALQVASAKEAQARKEAALQVLLFASKVGEAANILVRSVKSIPSRVETVLAIGRLGAPVAGAAKGLFVPSIGLGKSADELSPMESLAKKFPELQNIFKMELERQELLKVASQEQQKYAQTQLTLQEELAKNTDMPGREKLIEAQAKLVSLNNALTQSVQSANSKMSPYIEALTELSRLEQASKNLEDIVKGLKKIAELQFDETSLDIALGRHPLAPTPGVFGQPAGLDKFERQLYEIGQKQRSGPMSMDEHRNLELQKKKVEFAREEELIQYKQGKENQKLSQEVDAAKRAMGILWDAQYKGVEGLNPLISTLKSELASAGDVTSGGVGGKREFRGVPGLFGMQKEIAKVQEEVKRRELAVQKDVVMKDLENLTAEGNKTLVEIKGLLDPVGEKAKKDAEGIGKDALTGTKGIVAENVRLISSLGTTLADVLNSGSTAFSSMFDAIKSLWEGNLPQFGKALDDAASKLKSVEKVESAPSQRLQGREDFSLGVKKASGGMISGPGGTTGDKIPAMLSSGEFVMPAKTVSRYGLGFMEAIKKGALPGFRNGGPVGLGLEDYLLYDDEEKRKKLTDAQRNYAYDFSRAAEQSRGIIDESINKAGGTGGTFINLGKLGRNETRDELIGESAGRGGFMRGPNGEVIAMGDVGRIRRNVLTQRKEPLRKSGMSVQDLISSYDPAKSKSELSDLAYSVRNAASLDKGEFDFVNSLRQGLDPGMVFLGQMQEQFGKGQQTIDKSLEEAGSISRAAFDKKYKNYKEKREAQNLKDELFENIKGVDPGELMDFERTKTLKGFGATVGGFIGKSFDTQAMTQGRFNNKFEQFGKGTGRGLFGMLADVASGDIVEKTVKGIQGFVPLAGKILKEETTMEEMLKRVKGEKTESTLGKLGKAFWDAPLEKKGEMFGEGLPGLLLPGAGVGALKFAKSTVSMGKQAKMAGRIKKFPGISKEGPGAAKFGARSGGLEATEGEWLARQLAKDLAAREAGGKNRFRQFGSRSGGSSFDEAAPWSMADINAAKAPYADYSVTGGGKGPYKAGSGSSSGGMFGGDLEQKILGMAQFKGRGSRSGAIGSSSKRVVPGMEGARGKLGEFKNQFEAKTIMERVGGNPFDTSIKGNEFKTLKAAGYLPADMTFDAYKIARDPYASYSAFRGASGEIAGGRDKFLSDIPMGMRAEMNQPKVGVDRGNLHGEAGMGKLVSPLAAPQKYSLEELRLLRVAKQAGLSNEDTKFFMGAYKSGKDINSLVGIMRGAGNVTKEGSQFGGTGKALSRASKQGFSSLTEIRRHYDPTRGSNVRALTRELGIDTGGGSWADFGKLEKKAMGEYVRTGLKPASGNERLLGNKKVMLDEETSFFYNRFLRNYLRERAGISSPASSGGADSSTLSSTVRGHFASGGRVSGPGGSRADKVPAMLSSGEFVMPAHVVKKYGPGFFEGLMKPAKMADGGLVGGGMSLGFETSVLDGLIAAIKTATDEIMINLRGVQQRGSTPDMTQSGLIARRGVLQRPASELSGMGANAGSGFVKLLKDSLFSTFPTMGAAKQEQKKPDYAVNVGGKVMTGEQIESLVGPGGAVNMGGGKSMALAEIKRLLGRENEPHRGPLGTSEALRAEEIAASRAKYEVPGKESEIASLEEYNKYIKGMEKAGIKGGVTPGLTVEEEREMRRDTGYSPDERFGPDKVSQVDSDSRSKAATEAASAPQIDTGALAERLYSAILEGFKQGELRLDPDSISSIQRAVTEGVTAGSSSIRDAIVSSLSSLQSGLGGNLGPAVQNKLDELEGNILIVKDEVVKSNDNLITNINERFSDMETTITSSVDRTYKPEIVAMKGEMERIESFVKQVSAMAHASLARSPD